MGDAVCSPAWLWSRLQLKCIGLGRMGWAWVGYELGTRDNWHTFPEHFSKCGGFTEREEIAQTVILFNPCCLISIIFVFIMKSMLQASLLSNNFLWQSHANDSYVGARTYNTYIHTSIIHRHFHKFLMYILTHEIETDPHRHLYVRHVCIYKHTDA